jgi:Acetyltransferase (GNAT) domain
MDRVTFADLVANRASWDASVNETVGLDTWSTGSDWCFSTHKTWGTGPEVVLRSNDGWAAFGRLELEEANALIALDPVWGFASPIAGNNLSRLAVDVCTELEDIPDWDLLLLTGIMEGSPLDRACMGAFGQHHQLFGGPATVRLVADVSDVDAWWTRRGDKFRRNVRKAQRYGEANGLVIETLDSLSADEVINRLMVIEASSWKGQEESGLLGGDMGNFYRYMAVPLRAEQRLRASVATIDGVDVGYILGAVRADTYRGLQVSFAAGYEKYSIGHLLQHHELHRVAQVGVRRYDLGMDMPYKHHWSDSVEETRSLIVRR